MEISEKGSSDRPLSALARDLESTVSASKSPAVKRLAPTVNRVLYSAALLEGVLEKTRASVTEMDQLFKALGIDVIAMSDGRFLAVVPPCGEALSVGISPQAALSGLPNSVRRARNGG